MNDNLAVSRTVPSAQSWDRAGIVVSAACAVHCTLLPLLAGLLPVLGLQHLADERLEWTVLGITAVVGVVGHTRAYREYHRHIGPGLLFLTALVTIVLARLTSTSAIVEPVALGVGGGLAAAAHWINLRLCRCCADCCKR